MKYLNTIENFILKLNELLIYHENLFNGKLEDFNGLVNFESSFAWIFQCSLQDSMILGFFKLIDTKDAVLSIYKLIDETDINDNSKSEFNITLDTIVSKYQCIINYRHNTVAHTHAKIALKETKNNILPNTGEIREAIKEITHLFFQIKTKITGTKSDFKDSTILRSVNCFIRKYHKANAYIKLEGTSCIPVNKYKEILNAKNAKETKTLISDNSRLFSKNNALKNKNRAPKKQL